MYLQRTPISLAEAQNRLAALQPKPRVVSKKTRDARDYVLAADIHAPFPIPFFRRSGYDGYGILAADDADFPRDFEVVENIAAGDDFRLPLSPGQCVRIMTGAKVPDAVTKVIMLEQTQALDGERVRILNGASKSNIAEIGEEISEGDLILPQGTRCNAGAISVLAAFGISAVNVYDKPKVAVVATGSELTESAGHSAEGKIYNSNGPLLAGLTLENGATVTGEYMQPDNLEAMRNLMTKLTKENDLIITTGGVSVGDFDYMAVIAQENDCLFNKIAMRPGSPTTAFVLDETLVIALSGNPSACFAGFWFFAEPIIKRLQTLETAAVPYRGALAAGYRKRNEFDRYLNGVMDEDSTVSLNGKGASSELGSLWRSNCFFKIPADTTIPAGGEVDVWLIP